MAARVNPKGTEESDTAAWLEMQLCVCVCVFLLHFFGGGFNKPKRPATSVAQSLLTFRLSDFDSFLVMATNAVWLASCSVATSAGHTPTNQPTNQPILT